MPNEEELRACPFCGDEAEIYQSFKKSGERGTIGVSCFGCNATINGFKTFAQAAKAWNSRMMEHARAILPPPETFVAREIGAIDDDNK